MEKNNEDDENVQESPDSSMSLSLTPPILDDNDGKDVPKTDDSISEHLSSPGASVENDRSLHEIEIEPAPTVEENRFESLSQSLSGKSKSESFNIFADLDLDDDTLTQRVMQQVQGDVIKLAKELDSSTSTSGGTSTEYKEIHEDHFKQYMEYYIIIDQKNQLISDLKNNLQESLASRDKLLKEIEMYKKESSILTHDDFLLIFAQLEEVLDTEQRQQLNNLKNLVNSYVERKINKGKEEQKAEMEELRTYFERKCADLEKNYSEEILSHHSRRRSGSASTDDDLPLGGAGGDAPPSLNTFQLNHKKRALQKLTKSDLDTIKTDLEKMLELFNRQEDLDILKNELADFDVTNLFKIEMEAFRDDLKNKYNAELEILSQDYEERVDRVRVQHNEKLKEVEENYQEQIEHLKEVLNRTNRGVDYGTTVQEVVSSGDFEINEVVQSYERRLQEQVALAQNDLVTALENQIRRLAEDDGGDEEWPQELLVLRDRFAEKYEKQIADLRCENDGLKKQDNYKKRFELLRNLLGELFKYLTRCEDEVNGTIVDELVRQATEKNLTDLEKELNESTSSSCSLATARRVHLTPDFKDLIDELDATTTSSGEFSINVKTGLEACLEKLKNEANAILALTVNVPRHGDDDADQQKRIIASLERERSILEAQVVELVDRLNVAQSDLEKTRTKVAQLLEADVRREEVSEGYGGTTFTGHAETAFHQLQEKVRSILSNAQSTQTKDELLQLLDELVSVAERILDESKIENKDLKQQIEAADKKYQQTCKFLEEQAADRELERDDFQKRTSQLQEKLQTFDRDRANFVNVAEELEQLEVQLKEATARLDVQDAKLKAAEAEKNEAVEKIFFLRDIIADLETQVKAKAETEAELRLVISQFEGALALQNDAVADSDRRQEEETIDKGEDSQLSGVLKEFSNQLIDIETTIDKKTRYLEERSVNISTTACSSPSEDMSVRDVVRSKTPTDSNDCEIPLQQLARLKEKLVRHARAEDAALKRIRDLEMQVYNLKSSNDEYRMERDVLKKEIADQLNLVSSLQIRLDEQRIRAEHIEKRTNSSLENRIYDMQKEIGELEERLENRDKMVAHLNSLVEEMKKKIDDEKGSNDEDEMIVTMQREIEHLTNQNDLLRKRLNAGADLLPNIVENIISDKNSDIDLLRQKLATYEHKLEMYDNLNLDESQIEALKNLKKSGTSVLNLISFVDYDPARRDNTTLLDNHSDIRSETVPYINIKDISSIRPIRNDEVSELKSMLETKDAIIQQCNDKLKTLDNLETNIVNVQSKLEETQNSLKNVTENFETELKKKDETEKELKFELIQKRIALEELEKEVQMFREDATRKDNMYFDLAKETKRLKDEKRSLEDKLKEHQEITSIKDKHLLDVETEVGRLRGELDDIQIKYETATNEKIRDALSDNVQHLERSETEIRRLRDLLDDKEKIITQFKTDSERLQSNLKAIQTKMREQGNVIDLARKLRDEQIKNAELLVEIQTLKATLMSRDDETDDLTDFHRTQMEDAQLIEQLRIQLEAAGENELKFERMADCWRQRYEEAVAAKRNNSLLEYKSLPPKEDMELLRLKRELASLRNEVKTLKRNEKEQESTARLDKEMIALKTRELNMCEEKLDTLTRDLQSCNEELLQKCRELDELETQNRLIKEELEVERRRLPKETKSLPVADLLINKIEEMQSTAKYDRQTMDLLLKLTTDNKTLKSRVAELENAQRFDDPTNRSNFLFAKCLRVESYRKALIFQKQYLASLTLVGIADTNRLSGKRRFRCVAYAIVATLRMKYVVRRWHSGIRFAENLNTKYRIKSSPPTGARGEDLPWSGTTPPCREKSRLSSNLLNHYGTDRFGSN